MTFTEAATKELRDRIRARLAEAAGLLVEPAPVPRPTRASDLLARPARQLPGGRSGRRARARCGSPPNGWTRPRSPPSTAGATACCASTPSTAAACSPRRSRPTRASCWPKCVRDYWRSFIVPLDAGRCGGDAGEAGGRRPATLQQTIAEPDRIRRAAAAQAGPPAEVLRARHRRAHRNLQRLKKPWGEVGRRAPGACWTRPDAASAFDGRKLQAARLHQAGWTRCALGTTMRRDAGPGNLSTA